MHRTVRSGFGVLVMFRCASAQAAGVTRYSDARLRERELRLVQLGVDCGLSPCQVLVAETLHKRDALQSEIGSVVAQVGRAFGMRVICWGRDGSTTRAKAAGF